jgi:hypothetical protein
MMIVGCDLFLDKDDPNLNNLVGYWEGNYYNTLGMTLNVTKENSKYKAVFTFYTSTDLTSKRGSYRMDVSYTDGNYYLKFDQWIDHPSGWTSVDFNGKINGDVFSGDVIYTARGTPFVDGTFNVVKKR